MGTVKEIKLSIKPLKQTPRKVYIYLPTDYETSKKKYPVLYMFDGHNLFFDSVATYGKSWGLKEYLDKHHTELIVVGQDCNHTGNKRLWEYSPYDFQDNYYGDIKGQGEFTADWYVNTLKPYIDSHFRTYKDRKHTCIAGSSMGGLMSLYCVTKYNKYFSGAACLSSSFLFNQKELIQDVRKAKMNPDTKIYMDYGTRELGGKKGVCAAMHALLDINHILSEKGCDTFPNLVHNGEHSEASWEKIIPTFMHYLYK